ncbi:histidine phosphatase family protein [Bifidobacterium canis]|uniref:Phosphoglycerate mutase n=1 Tax=Bifidobacterium canis TaxID=2610880 RepID=A0A7K1J6Y2_9BIFI|nr:histidine phosphatase family protein [Bifidobacterium canis]MUH60225.1 phosphoglycerate mutase [Bifidobacterium canis]
MIDEVMFMRHGRTSFNLERRLQGQIDIPLDIVGQWQVDMSGYTLAQRFYWAKASNIARHPDRLPQPTDPDVRRSDIEEYRKSPAARRRIVVVSSDLFRAQQTAHAFADPLGLDVTLDERLRERDFGKWEGMTREEIQSKYPEGYRSWKAHDGGEREYGVETRSDLGARGAQTILSYCNDPQYMDEPTTLFVVSHGSWIAATIGNLMGLPDNKLDNLTGMRNAFWSRLEPRYNANGTQFTLTEYDKGPDIADTVDWENGPDYLRNPDMPMWKPLN